MPNIADTDVMASIRSRIFYTLLRLGLIQKDIRQEIVTQSLDQKLNYFVPPDLFYRKFKINTHLVHTHPVYTLCSLSEPVHHKKCCILYIHSGSFSRDMKKKEWHLIADIITKKKYTVVAPDYFCASEYKAIDAYRMVYEVYESLVVTREYDSISIVGDFLGGGITLGISELIKKRFFKLPSKIVLLSPWLDIEMKNPQIVEYVKSDLVQNLTTMLSLGKSYAGNLSTNDFRVSPIKGISEGLPSIVIFTSTCDILYPDAVLLRRLCEQHGVHIHFYVYEDMGHNWILDNLPESNEARVQLMNELSE